MKPPIDQIREGSLEAPTRHPLDWHSDEFWNEEALNLELERVYDICHSCRRCVSLCESFPTLFDLIDESSTMELDGVDKADYRKVVEHCYLCDLCFQTKCPYVPPHEWNVDFPHLMLRAKAVYHQQKKPPLSQRFMASTTAVGKLVANPGIAGTVNALNRMPVMRKALDRVMGVHPEAELPQYHSRTLRRRMKKPRAEISTSGPAGPTRGKVALFVTCYCNANAPGIVEDLVKVLEHNGVPVTLTTSETCCGMPRLEHGNLDAVNRSMNRNIPELARLIDSGHDIVVPIPSCTLMFKQELPLMHPENAEVGKVRNHLYDPFEYLALRHKGNKLKTDFKQPLGAIAWHVPCHQRVQNIGPKTRELLELVPETEIHTIERCSGHDGTYGVRTATYPASKKIARGTVGRIKRKPFEWFVSDCPMAATHLASELDLEHPETLNPITLLRLAYGLD